MRTALLALIPLLLSLSACEQEIGTSGYDLSALFPEAEDWFWKYDNDDTGEVSYWHHVGDTSPDGEAWRTFRAWFGDEQDVIEGIAADETGWAFDLYFANHSGWHLMGWSANPDGPMASMGQVFYDGDGVPIALANVVNGTTWTAQSGGFDWTVTPASVPETLSFNGNEIDGAWDIVVASDAGNTDFEGTWTLVGARGFVRFDLVGLRPANGTGAFWELVRDAPWSDVLGASN